MNFLNYKSSWAKPWIIWDDGYFHCTASGLVFIILSWKWR